MPIIERLPVRVKSFLSAPVPKKKIEEEKGRQKVKEERNSRTSWKELKVRG